MRPEYRCRPDPACGPGGRGYGRPSHGPDSFSPHPIPIASRSCILRRPARGRGRPQAFHAWRKLRDFSIIQGLPQGMDERKPLIRLGS